MNKYCTDSMIFLYFLLISSTTCLKAFLSFKRVEISLKSMPAFGKSAAHSHLARQSSSHIERQNHTVHYLLDQRRHPACGERVCEPDRVWAEYGRRSGEAGDNVAAARCGAGMSSGTLMAGAGQVYQAFPVCKDQWGMLSCWQEEI